MPKNPQATHLMNTGHSWLEQPATQPPPGHKEYPKTLHHKSGKTTVANTPDDAKNLGGDWDESPAKWAGERAKEAEASHAASLAADKAAIDKEAAAKKAELDRQAAQKAAADKAAADKVAAEKAATEKAAAEKAAAEKK